MEPSLHILHLEDDPRDGELVQATLESEGIECRITRVESRDEYVESLGKSDFQLILADYTLPGFDGMTALRLTLDHCGPAIPFLFVSGTLGEEIAADAIKLGAVDYVLKNHLQRLPQAVRRALREAEEYRQRRRAEDALRESEERFRTLTETLPQIVWSAGVDGVLDYLNQRWEEYTGVPAQESLSGEWNAVFHPDDLAATVQMWSDAVAGATEHRIEHRIRRHDGEYRWFLTWAQPLRDNDGRIVRWLGSSTDIHDQKLAQEQLRQINELLERRVHERTRTLREHQEQLRAMASDLTLTEQRERRRLASELHDYLAQLLVASKMKMRLLTHLTRSQRGESIIADITDLLEQSIKYTRTLIAELSPTILYEAGLVAAVRWLAEQMHRHGLRVEVHEDENPIEMPDDQAVLVFQTIRELLINVAKHAMVHEAAVFLEQREAGQLNVTVADRGVGFDSSTKEGPTAAGKYGLFSIRERLEALGGTFSIDSSAGKGTRAMFTVPLATVEPAEPVEAERPELEREPVPAMAEPPRPNRSGRRRITRVLLADDHHMVREGLRSLIESEPRLRVVGEASNGEEAVQQARLLQPDVVVMDINMPKLNGIEATRRIKEESPEIVVIALSMHEDKSMVAAMKEAGAAAYIPKDGAAEDLSRAIREAHSYSLSGDNGVVASGNP
jgi:PAS domain S-box-containing protein